MVGAGSRLWQDVAAIQVDHVRLSLSEVNAKEDVAGVDVRMQDTRVLQLAHDLPCDVEGLLDIDLAIAVPEEEVCETFRVRDEFGREVGSIEHAGGVRGPGHDRRGRNSPFPGFHARFQLADRTAVPPRG